MATIFQKLRTAILGNLHDLLDKTIDLNSIAAVKQHCRDLEEAKDKTQDAAAKARAELGILEGQVKAIELKIGQDNEHIDLLLGDDDPSNDNVAEKIQERVLENEENVTGLREELANAKEISDSLADAVGKINGKHAEMLRNIRKLERLDRAASGKEQAASALKQAGSAVSAAGSASIDDVAARLKGRAAVADERFKDAMGGVSGIEEAVSTAKAKNLIAERRAKLAAAKAGQSGS